MAEAPRSVLLALALAVVASGCSGGGSKEKVSAESKPAAEAGAGGDSVSTLTVPEMTTAPARAPVQRSPSGSDGAGATGVVPNGSSSNQPPATTPSTAPKPTAPPNSARKISYPAGGPKGPEYPDPPTPAYELFAQHTQQSCTDLHSAADHWSSGPLVQLLYQSAADACLQRWQAAAREYDELQAVGPDFEPSSCHGVVYTWLTSVIEAYRSGPEPPQLVAADPGSPRPDPTSCG